jgi:hypothetical protein
MQFDLSGSHSALDQAKQFKRRSHLLINSNLFIKSGFLSSGYFSGAKKGLESKAYNSNLSKYPNERPAQ